MIHNHSASSDSRPAVRPCGPAAKRAAFLLLAFVLSGCCAAKPLEPSRIIDTHIHLYDTSRPQGVPWPGKNEPILYKPHLPADFAAIAKANDVKGTVIVEASGWVDDNQWLLDLVKDDPHYVGIVGNLWPGKPDFKENLERFAKDKRFRGIRPRVDAPLTLTAEGVLADLQLLADKGLTLDIITSRSTLEQVAIVAEKIPNLKIVINHLAGVKVDGKEPDAIWTTRVKACAKHPNVYCKISGLDQQDGSRPAATALAFYTPVLNVLYDAFGEDRLIYGSNWPVTNLRSDYATHRYLVVAYFRPKGQAVLDKVFWKNATKAYGLE
ncbi:MAG: amidohydrolase family protein [Phycisphaeraceae bacterium]